jgi:IS30 family transposase
MQYSHFSIEEREQLQEMLWQKCSIRTIAKTLGRSPSSVSREIKRNLPPLQKRYTPRLAHERALEKRTFRGRKLRLKSVFVRRYVIDKLKAGFSPEQIAGRLSLEHPEESISHEAIYQYIYRPVHRGKVRPGYPDLRVYLKRRQKKGMRKGQRIFRLDGRSIDVRPAIVDRRTRLGDWEGDTIASADHHPGLNSLVDRKSGLLLLSKLSASTAAATHATVTERLTGLPAHTLTLDNGRENLYWQEIEESTGVRIYYAHPYHSWERGANENTNGLVRWYFPKGTDFATISEEAIKAVEEVLNNRPRKRLGWRTPAEVFYSRVALQG